jgi:hypothetical protein
MFAYQSAFLASDVTLNSGANTISGLGLTVPVPSSGCPCRIHVVGFLYYNGGTSTLNHWITDGLGNTISSGQVELSSGFNSGIGIDDVSPTTYANNAGNVVLTLNVYRNGSSCTLSAAPAYGSGTHSWLKAWAEPSN